MVKIGLLGASGNLGADILKELSSRGKYEIIGISRHADKIDSSLPGVTAVTGDASKPEELASKIHGINVLVSALLFDVAPSTLVEEAKKAGAERIIAVGGAGSLHVSEGGPLLIDTPDFPEEYKELAQAGVNFLEDFRKIKDFDWSVISPPAEIEPGQKLGKYRLGKDVLLTDSEGNSRISNADFAIAIADEIEKHAHAKTRFTVAY